MKHKTKILATIGPASSDRKVIQRMVEAGMNGARINFSHGDHRTHRETIAKIRAVEKALRRPIGILADLGGPKIRIGKLSGGRPIYLKNGDIVTFASEKGAAKNEIPFTYPEITRDLRPGDQILLDDGKLAVRVEKVAGGKITAKVVCGGMLKEHKGMNFPGVTLSSSAVTKKDEEDLKFALASGVDFIGVSFVQSASDIAHIKRLIKACGRPVPVVAKIERQTAINNLESIMEMAEAVMIARGDLGVETPLENVPILQKRIIALGTKYRRPVVVATQMLESMIESDRPTRAEVSDVANSVFDGADVVMLSAETAAGHDPVGAVRTMARIVEASEASRYHAHGTYELDHRDDSVPVATTRAACFAAEEAGAKAICIFTMTGRSALYVSKQRPDVHIIAMTDTDETARRLSMFYGVRPLKIPRWKNIDSMISCGMDMLRSERLAVPGDKIVIVCGTTTTPGATNMIKIQQLA